MQTNTVLSLIDAQAAATLRMALISRMDVIKRIHPLENDPNRIRKIAELYHLANELGIQVFMFEG